jgi:ATP-binding cassette subfamily B protein
MSGVGPLIRRFLRSLKPHLKLFPPILASILLEMAFYAGLPFSLRYVIDYGLIGGDHRLLAVLIGGLLAAAVLVAVLGFIRDRLYARLNATVLTDQRLAIFDHLQSLSMDFFATNPVGDILARFSNDFVMLETAMNNAISWGILPGLSVLGGTVLLFVLNWKLALIALSVWPVTLAGPRALTPRVAAESYHRKTEEARTLSLLQEYLNAQVIVKAFGLEGFWREEFLERLQALRMRMIRVTLFSGLVERSAYVGIMFVQVSVLALGAYLVTRGALTVGELAAFQAIFLTTSYALATVSQFVPTAVEAFGGLRRIEDIFECRPRVADEGTEHLPESWCEIRFNNVSFGYSGGRTSLQQLDLTIPQGQSVAIIGSSGSGKSTFLNLLMRFYDPDAGAVTIGRTDLRCISAAGLRSRIGYVPQDSLLFNLSVRENIRLGKPGATDGEVEAAARAAEVHEAIMRLANGYETPVGERGGRLSGGQRQRVALARAIIRNPDILILDEATSALDPATEAAILTTIERMRQTRTVVCVTHRLSSVTRADRLFVLERGRLCEEGTHEELISRPGPYRSLWDKQHGFTTDERRHVVEISMDRLRLVPVFYGMPDDLLSEAVHLFRGEEYPEDRVIVQEGEISACLYIIVRGTVQLSSSRLEAGALMLEEGDCFGESALLEGTPEDATVRTLVPCVLLTLNRGSYLYLRARHS